MSIMEIQRYQNEIKDKSLLSYINAKNIHFKNQATALLYIVGGIWPVFGFSSILHQKPDSLLSVAGAFLAGIFPSALLGGLIFALTICIGKEFIFRLFKNYRTSYNNLLLEKQNLINMFKDLKNQKIILDFISWKRKYHLTPIIFQDYKTKSVIDFEKLLVSALANKDYSYAASLFLQFSEHLESSSLIDEEKIKNYREQLDIIKLDNKEMELEMDMPIKKSKIQNML